jgi:PIN domain nuclease of toxin-antitoxin system
MRSVVLDLSALRAVLLRRPAHEAIVPHLAQAALSSVALAELLHEFTLAGADPRVAGAMLHQFAIEIVPFDEPQAIQAVQFASLQPGRRLSLASRAALALALFRSARLVTTDAAVAEAAPGVDVVLVR